MKQNLVAMSAGQRCLWSSSSSSSSSSLAVLLFTYFFTFYITTFSINNVYCTTYLEEESDFSVTDDDYASSILNDDAAVANEMDSNNNNNDQYDANNDVAGTSAPSSRGTMFDYSNEYNSNNNNNNNNKRANTMQNRTKNNSLKCGNTQKMVDNCFRDLSPHLMEFLQTTKIAINEQEITSKCEVFQRGMKCFDDYATECIPENNVNILKNNVEGAKKFFTKFCEDREFQNDYLKHKKCFSYIQDDWMHCTKTFQNILIEALHAERNFTHKFMEFCCARYAYETCIYNSARYKCYKNSADFARDTAKMLSDEKHFTQCRQYEHSLCNTTARHSGSSSSIISWHYSHNLQGNCSNIVWLILYFLFLRIQRSRD